MLSVCKDVWVLVLHVHQVRSNSAYIVAVVVCKCQLLGWSLCLSLSLSLYTFAVHVNRDLCSSEVVGLFEIHCSEIRKVLAQTSED